MEKKEILLAAVLAASSAHACAADFGVGVSVQSDDAWIYVPIDVTPKFRIEPSIRFIDGESQSRTTSVRFGLPVTTTVTSEGQTYEFAVGLFGLAPIGESARVYYGARAAYIDSESKLRIVSRFGSFEDVENEKSSSSGYRISPTLGFEYLFGERFSIGGEAEWFYQDVDADRSDSISGASWEADAKSNGTDTRLIVRFKF